MASIEFLTSRIEGAKKNIEKIEKKIVRIKKAQSTNWEVNPYYYNERDLKSAERDLEKAIAAFEKYAGQLKTEEEKAASRNIPVIVDFLERWKNRVEAFYKKVYPQFREELEDWYKEDHEYCDWFIHNNATPAERKTRREEHTKAKREFNSKWNWMIQYCDCFHVLEENRLKKDLEQEANRKYDFIVERCNAICGTITDAAGLTIGEKDDLNGFIIGEKGTAKVQTIGAGGYNIQCYHFRTLIHEVK